jgi:hypothetical protein
MFLGYFTSTTTRNARGVTTADVEQRATCIVGGVMYEAILAGTTSACWRRVAAAGAWTGDGVAGTNVAGIGAVIGAYHVIGTQVFLSGAVASVNPTAGAPTATDFELPIPIASNFAATTDAHGIAMGSVFTAGVVTGSIANDRIVVTGSFSADTTISIYVNASYTLL